MRLKKRGKLPILHSRVRRYLLVGLFVPIGASLIIVSWSLLPRAPGAGLGVEHVVDEHVLPKLPPPADAPQVNLPRFKYTHPRLPSPSAADLATIVVRNPDFLRQIRIRAAGGSGDIEAAALQELIDPG